VREQVLRASLEGPGTMHEEPEGIGQPADYIERETDCECILNLLARSAGGEDRPYVVNAHRMIARQLAQHEQCRPQGLLNDRDVKVRQYCGDPLPVVIGSPRDRRVRLCTEFALVSLRHLSSH